MKTLATRFCHTSFARFVSIEVLGFFLLGGALGAGGLRAAVEAAKDTKPQAAITSVPARDTNAEFAAALLAETNRVRREYGCRPLRARAELNTVADEHAAYMAITLHVSHQSALYDRRTPVDRVRQRVSEEGTVGENVASIPLGREDEPDPPAKIAALLVQQWMDSPGHRRNLLAREFTQFGGAVRLTRIRNERWYAYGAQLFFKPASSSLRGGLQ